ncbi:hypothetical protein Nepgr_008935 [Nepenthes gracilis]|uniref:Uncharacterized protein n=1 Tax=Nepenthes gracilis TaxID=150966 RepID=A0AAD3XJW0_NEPGR|nr:hypothetical protein Nepgr_008935 [Nepenthes gracilis]
MVEPFLVLDHLCPRFLTPVNSFQQGWTTFFLFSGSVCVQPDFVSSSYAVWPPNLLVSALEPSAVPTEAGEEEINRVCMGTFQAAGRLVRLRRWSLSIVGSVKELEEHGNLQMVDRSFGLEFEGLIGHGLDFVDVVVELRSGMP